MLQRCCLFFRHRSCSRRQSLWRSACTERSVRRWPSQAHHVLNYGLYGHAYESSCNLDLLASSFALDLNCISITCRPLNFQSFRPRSDNNCVINQIEVTGSVSRDSVCTSTCCMASPASLSFHCAGSEPKPEDSTIFRMSSSPVLF